MALWVHVPGPVLQNVLLFVQYPHLSSTCHVAGDVLFRHKSSADRGRPVCSPSTKVAVSSNVSPSCCPYCSSLFPSSSSPLTCTLWPCTPALLFCPTSQSSGRYNPARPPGIIPDSLCPLVPSSAHLRTSSLGGATFLPLFQYMHHHLASDHISFQMIGQPTNYFPASFIVP